MKKFDFFVSIVLSFLFLTALNVKAETRTALVIGNSSYESSPLKNPINDATDVATVLKASGFNVTLKTNANQRTMETSIRAFGKALKSGGIGLFYYAGHGLQIKGNNYLIPIGATLESEGDTKYEAVDAGLVLAKMEDAQNDLNIVILDACRNNPFARSFRSASTGLARMDAPKGSIVAYATSPGGIAADGFGRNGVYTKHLIQNIQNPQLTIEQVFKKVRVAVVTETSNKQVPWESSSLMGTFYFDNQKNALHASVQTYINNETIEKQQELIFWESIKNSKNAKLFETYMEQYPNGKFIKIASIYTKQYKPEAVVITNKTEKEKNIKYSSNRKLQWLAAPSHIKTPLAIRAWLAKTNQKGHHWRLPSRQELVSLFDKNYAPKNISKEFNFSVEIAFYSTEYEHGAGVAGFNFRVGKDFKYKLGYNDTTGVYQWGALAVRAIKTEE